MLCTIVGSVLNIILDYIFVISLDMGVVGAALATGLAFAVSFIVGFVPYFSKGCILRFTSCTVDFKKIGKFFYNGSSEALTEVAVAYTTFLFNMVLLKNLGETGVAAFSIISYVTALVIAALIGISTGISPITSYNYGATNTERVIRLNRLGIQVMIGLGVLCTLIMFVFGEPLIALFAPNEPELLELTLHATKLYSLAFLINGINILASAYFTALGDAKTSACISVCRGILFITIGIIILPPLFGTSGIWLSVVFSELITLCYTLYLIKRSYRRLRGTVVVPQPTTYSKEMY